MPKELKIKDLQKTILDIYGIPDDQLYSVEDLLYYGQKFALLALKKLEDGDKEGAILNYSITLAWFTALINRYHFELEKVTWKRYSFKCPFCLEIPCICENKEEQMAKKTGRPSSRRPKNIENWQEMIKKIYPEDNIQELSMVFLRKADDLNYSYRLFLREKLLKHFKEIEIKSADYFVLLLRIFNALEADITNQFHKMFKNGCHVCHKTPCECNYK